tara:strand:+ start:484 stop:837 length:354 start_codon:yes stop_codon:yes gene_type:complete
MVSAMNYSSHPVKTLIALALLELCMNTAHAEKIAAVNSCPGVYRFYGAPVERTGVKELYYISSGKAPLIRCLKKLRITRATPLDEYLNGLPERNKKYILSVKDMLQIQDPYIQSLGI